MTKTLHPHPGAIRVVTCNDGRAHCFTLSGVEAHAIRIKLDSDKATCGPHVILLYGAPTMYYDDEKTMYSVFEETQEETIKNTISHPAFGKKHSESMKVSCIHCLDSEIAALRGQLLLSREAREYDREQFRHGVTTWEKRVAELETKNRSLREKFASLEKDSAYAGGEWRKAEKKLRKTEEQVILSLEQVGNLRGKLADVEKREKELRGLLSRVSQTYCNYGCPNISPDGLHSEVCRKVQAASKE